MSWKLLWAQGRGVLFILKKKKKKAVEILGGISSIQKDFSRLPLWILSSHV